MLDMTPPRCGLHLGEAAIHEQFGSRDVAAVVGCEKHHGLGDLLWRAGPADRNTARRHLQVLLGRFGDMPRGCVDEARAHGVDANAAILQVRRPCPRKRAHGGLGGVVHAPLRRSYTASDGRIQDDRGPIGHQWKRLLHREQEALHVDVEDRVEVLFSDLAQGRKLGPTGIREDNIQLGLLALDVCEEPIKIAEVRHVALETADISSDLLYRRRQLQIAAPRDEDVRAFVHELLRGRKANAAVATGNECSFSFKLTHDVLPSLCGADGRRRARGKALAAARYHEIRDDDLNGLVVLVERRRSHLDQPLIGTRPRGPHLENLALGAQLISRPHRPWPAELVSAGAHDATGGFEVAVDQEPHGDGGGVPTAGDQSSEDRVAGGFLVGMERLRIELGAECLDSLLVDPQPTGAKGLPDGKVFEESPNHGHWPPSGARTRGRGQTIGPNQAPVATAPAVISPNAARAAPSAAKTYETSALQRSASQPPPAAITSRTRFASSGHSSRPAPCDAKYSARPSPKRP